MTPQQDEYIIASANPNAAVRRSNEPSTHAPSQVINISRAT